MLAQHLVLLSVQGRWLLHKHISLIFRSYEDMTIVKWMRCRDVDDVAVTLLEYFLPGVVDLYGRGFWDFVLRQPFLDALVRSCS
jgi:hypothetical protein